MKDDITLKNAKSDFASDLTRRAPLSSLKHVAIL